MKTQITLCSDYPDSATVADLRRFVQLCGEHAVPDATAVSADGAFIGQLAIDDIELPEKPALTSRPLSADPKAER